MTIRSLLMGGAAFLGVSVLKIFPEKLAKLSQIFPQVLAVRLELGNE